jgi:hypothetical protein
MKKIFLFLLSSSLLISCSVHQGTISSSSTDRNIVYEDLAHGVSQTNKYFGIGGLMQDAMVLEAKRKMMSNRPLGANEQYFNLTTDFKRTYLLFFYSQTKAMVSADVVRFTEDPVSEPYSELYKLKLFGKDSDNTFFEIGDTIFDKNFSKGIVISNEKPGQVRILYNTQTDKLRTKTISVHDIFTINKSHNGFSTGDWFAYTVKDTKGGEQPVALKIEAIGLTSLIVRNQKDKLVEIKYNKQN